MKLFIAIVLGIMLAGASLAQAPSKSAAGNAAKIQIAVIEFTPGPNASGMTYEAKRHLQAAIAYLLAETRKFRVVDVRNTREMSQADLPVVNGTSTAAAVRVGKQLNVSYVLTGTVIEYNTKGTATLRARLVEVATGKVKYSGEITQQSTSAMTARAGEPEMMTKVLKPAIQKITADLTAGF